MFLNFILTDDEHGLFVFENFTRFHPLTKILKKSNKEKKYGKSIKTNDMNSIQYHIFI